MREKERLRSKIFIFLLSQCPSIIAEYIDHNLKKSIYGSALVAAIYFFYALLKFICTRQFESINDR